LAEKTLHIVSFTIPYPADFGGVMDVFHKLRSLKAAGASVILHCFQYDRNPAQELEELCLKVFYYPRKTGFIANLSLNPYIIQSRNSHELLKNLCKDEFPILFEGLHSCYYLGARELSHRTKIVRTHNIEHRYYRELSLSERNAFKKLYLRAESLKLRRAERVLLHASDIAAISVPETIYYQEMTGRGFLLNPFHASDDLQCKPGQGNYILYHANLGVPDNEKSALYLAEKVFSKLAFPVKIAGRNPSAYLVSRLKKYSGIEVAANPSPAEMDALIAGAHASVLYSFQSSGTKLKLIDALFRGRFVVCNSNVVRGTGLEGYVYTADHPEEMVRQIELLRGLDYTDQMKEKRNVGLQPFMNLYNAKELLNRI
jgi:hypothetical protein